MRAQQDLIATNNTLHRRFGIGLVALLLAAVSAGPAIAAAPSQPAGPSRSVIVQGTSEAAARAAVAAHQGTVTGDLWIVNGVAADVPEGEVASLEAEPGVTHVSSDVAVHVQDADPSPLHAATAAYSKVVGADQLWAEGVDGDGITVAVVDTGIAKVADLAGRVIGGVDFSGGGDPYKDEFGHGTFVAGLIAGDGTSSFGQYKGVAPKAKLVSIKIAGADGSSDVSHVLAAMQWAVSYRGTYGIKVLNLSLGTDSTQTYHLSPLNSAVERAWDSGIVVTVSASNNGPGAGTITKPGDDPLVVTVGAIDDVGTVGRTDDVLAGFSGQGPTTADGLTKPDLVAPGRSVIGLRAPGSAIDVAYPGSRVGSAYFKGSGTSFSTAVTSGAAALIIDREPGLSPDQVKARLLGSASAGPVGNPNVDGQGSLNAYAAAHAGTFNAANVGVARSLGTGSIELDRGSLHVQIQTGGLLGGLLGLLAPVLELLTSNETAQNKVFDAVGFLTTDWSSSRWYDSQWGSSRWYSSRWYGANWYSSRWYSSRWYGATWYGIAWE
ncbi:MAG TPA: S8 family peptidase [Acidimicrobiia bacterium]|jgi:serine protease AprX|nr:S8 family peptidase [Acidimicrobiia bacterium]